MNQPQSLLQFLDEIDPEQTMDRKKVVSDITSVALLKAILQSKELLTAEQSDKLDLLISDKNNFDMDKVYEVFRFAGKSDEFIQNIDRISRETTNDYIDAQIKALSPEKRGQIINKFPLLRE